MEQRLIHNSVLVIETECWEWIGRYHTSKGGLRYGAINVRENGRHLTKQAHRVSIATFYGPIPDGYEVDHLCMNTLCINPGHLRAVPPVDNKARIRVERGCNGQYRSLSSAA